MNRISDERRTSAERLFFAINFEESLRERITQQLLTAIPADGFSKTNTSQLHLTLLFMGPQPPDAVKRLVACAQECVLFGPFDAQLKGTGHFNRKILWLGTGQGTRELEELAGCLCRATQIRSERFHPHITLARTKGAAEDLFNNVFGQLQSVPFSERVRIRGFDLMGSRLEYGGPKYRCIQSFEFE